MKYINKCILLLPFLILGHIHSSAQDNVEGVIAELSTGENLFFYLTDHPQFMYDGKTITLTSDIIKLEYKPTELAKVMIGNYSQINNSIEQVTFNSDIKVTNGVIQFYGFQSNEDVRIFSSSGYLLGVYHISESGQLEIPFFNLPKGVSIIRTNRQSIKISKQ